MIVACMQLFANLPDKMVTEKQYTQINLKKSTDPLKVEQKCFATFEPKKPHAPSL